MSRGREDFETPGDAVTLFTLLPFCLWLGWWGILPAFLLGWIVNILDSKEEP